MAALLTWTPFDDVHVDEPDGYERLSRLCDLIAVGEAHRGDPVAFALLPGDLGSVSFRIGDGIEIPMARFAATSVLWTVAVDNAAGGLHRPFVRSGGCDGDGDGDGTVEVFVRNSARHPKRTPTVALGRDVNAAGPWSERGIDCARHGPNTNGRDG